MALLAIPQNKNKDDIYLRVSLFSSAKCAEDCALGM